MKAFKILLAMMALGLAEQGWARILNVPDDFGTIQAGINDAEAGDTVLVLPGVYQENLTINRSLTLGSLTLMTGDSAYVDSTVIDGQRRNCCITDASQGSVTIRGFTIRNGEADNGGGIRSTNPNALTLEDLLITRCYGSSGAGISTSVNGQGQVILEHVKLIDNTAEHAGGAIVCGGGGLVSLTDCVLTGNTAESFGGGAIYSYGDGSRTLTGCVLANNNAGNHGGAISSSGDGSFTLTNCVLSGSSANGYAGGAIYNGGEGYLTLNNCVLSGNSADRYVGGAILCDANLRMDNVLLYGNHSGGGGAICHWDTTTTMQLNHVTVANNRANSVSAIYSESAEPSWIKNSIFYGNVSNDGGLISISDDGALDLIYNDIEGGRGSVSGPVGEFSENIDQDPHFVDSRNGDFHLTDDSPCIDSGDPCSRPDRDWSRTDMGAYGSEAPDMILSGAVVRAIDDSPIPNASVYVEPDVGETASVGVDAGGEWMQSIAPWFADSLRIKLIITSDDFNSDTSFVFIPLGDSLHVVTRLYQSEFYIAHDSLTVILDSSASTQQFLTINNFGNGPLVWQAVTHTRGDAGYAPWTLRQSLPVSQITGDERIDGVIFDGESYFCAGVNGDNPNMIYHLSREGVLLDSFPQPGHSRYGFKDMEWDGELIWGSGEDSVFAINRDGEVVQRWFAPFSQTNNIAYDNHEQVLWLSGMITDIKAYDCEGNYLSQTINRQRLRIYGLSWYDDHPDSACLYALNTPNADTTQINKFNTQTGEMQTVITLPPDSSTSVNNAFICRNFDKYQGWVMMIIAKLSANRGGDQLRIFQLQPNTEWLTVTPDSGVVPPDGNTEVEISVRTSGRDDSWALGVGEYECAIVFTHSGLGDQTILPVYLTIIDPNGVGKPTSEQVDKFELFAAYPNPFNSSTTISFGLEESAQTSLRIYNLQGRLVDVLVSSFLSAGRHAVVWDGAGLAAGVYLIQLESEDRITVSKGVIIK